MSSTYTYKNPHLTKQDQNYCEKSAIVYQSDFAILNNRKVYAIIEESDRSVRGYAKVPNGYITYKAKQQDDTFILKKSIKVTPPDVGTISDIDMLSKYTIFKSRGCEDQIPKFSVNSCLKNLEKIKNHYYDNNIKNLMYLYIYLLINIDVTNYYFESNHENRAHEGVYYMNKPAPKAWLADIFDLYNLLVVYIQVFNTL